MPEIRFEWDENKNSVNKRKHGVSFTEGQTAFADENGLLFDDPDHSEDEERVVSHTYSAADLTIRIISARRANSSEKEQYWERW